MLAQANAWPHQVNASHETAYVVLAISSGQATVNARPTVRRLPTPPRGAMPLLPDELSPMGHLP
eukprot:5253444-Alexandrium_andersonii.AAC.1